MTALPGWARVVVRRMGALGIVCGVYASALWYYVQDTPRAAVLVAGLTVALVALVIYNERFGAAPLYP